MATKSDKIANELSYTSDQLFDDLNGIPTLDEIRRLADCYPSYAKAWRTGLLQGILDGKSHTEMVIAKIRAKGAEAVTPQAKGGYATTIPAKLRKTAIRMLYLHYRLDQGMSRKHAHDALMRNHPTLVERIDRKTLSKYTFHPPFPGWVLPI